MLRKPEERELDRTFERIETREEFLTRWNTIDTEQEAVGLLYGGTSVFPFDLGEADHHAEKQAEIESRIGFYLRVADYKNSGAVAETAQQLIVKYWLRRLGRWSLGNYPTYLKAHVSVLNFLKEPRASILKPPYPRFVSEYLLNVNEEWRYGSPPQYQRGFGYSFLQHHTELIVKVLCVWGLAYILPGTSTIRLIGQFLKENNYDPKQILAVLADLPGKCEPLSDLSSEWAKDTICARAARAYLQMLHLQGRISLNLEHNA